MGAVGKSIAKVTRGSRRVLKAVGLGGLHQAIGAESFQKMVEDSVLDPTRNAPVAGESEASKLAKQQEDELEARRRAIAGLTQTSTLGAGTPKTTRKSVLGV